MSEANDFFGVPHSEANDTKYVTSLAQTFEIKEHFSGCFKSQIFFSTFLQYSGCQNVSYFKKIY